MSDAQTLYFAGLKKHRHKDYTGAIESLLQALEVDSEHADAWEALGVLYEKTDQLDQAIAAMEKLAAIRPDEVMAHTNLSRFYMKKGWTEKAEEEQSKARVLGWKLDLASGNAGGADFAQANAAEASPASPQLASFLPGGPQAPVAPPSPPGADREVLEQRIQQFEKLAQASPEDILSRFSLGKLYLKAERAADAARVLEELLELKADYTAAYPLLGEALEQSGKLARALRIYTHGIELAEKKGDLHPRNQMQERLNALRGSSEA